MGDNIEKVQTGIYCDNTECDYKDDGVQYQDYKDWINRPCPKCGENLLTQEDFDNGMLIDNAVDILNAMTLEQLEEFFKDIDVTELAKALDIESLAGEFTKAVSMVVDTHKGITITELKTK